MTVWGLFSLNNAFLPLQIPNGLLCKIEVEGTLVILIALNWLGRMLYSDIFNLLADAMWAPSERLDLLSQGPVFHPVS